MISFNELLGPKNNINDVPILHQHNLEDLLVKINKIRTAWAKPMTITSGYRSMQDHLRIYSEINAKLRKAGKAERKVPMGSKHLLGLACDVSDPDGSLHDWCVANTKLLEDVGLWCEVKDDAARVHFQSEAPASKKRFFIP